MLITGQCIICALNSNGNLKSYKKNNKLPVSSVIIVRRGSRNSPGEQMYLATGDPQVKGGQDGITSVKSL